MKKVSKLIAVLLMLTLSLGLLAACDNPPDPNDGKPLFKLGMFSGTEGTPTYPWTYQIIAACKAWNVEVDQVALAGYDGDSFVNGIETMINDGCDAIITWVLSEELLPTIAKKCADAGVLLGVQDNFGLNHNGDVYKTLMQFDNVIVLGGKDEYKNGYAAAEILTDAGCKNIAILTSRSGTMMLNRYNGIITCLSDNGATVDTLFEDAMALYSPVTAHDAVASIIAAYPDLDGICLGGMTQLCVSGVVQAIQESGRDIKLSAVDFDVDMQKYMESGIMPGFMTCSFSIYYWNVAELANAATGHRLTDGINDLEHNYVKVDTIEKCQLLFDMIGPDCKGLLYDDDEFRSHLVIYNSKLDAATFESLVIDEDFFALASEKLGK